MLEFSQRWRNFLPLLTQERCDCWRCTVPLPIKSHYNPEERVPMRLQIWLHSLLELEMEQWYLWVPDGPGQVWKHGCNLYILCVYWGCSHGGIHDQRAYGILDLISLLLTSFIANFILKQGWEYMVRASFQNCSQPWSSQESRVAETSAREVILLCKMMVWEGARTSHTWCTDQWKHHLLVEWLDRVSLSDMRPWSFMFSQPCVFVNKLYMSSIRGIKKYSWQLRPGHLPDWKFSHRTDVENLQPLVPCVHQSIWEPICSNLKLRPKPKQLKSYPALHV